MDAPHFTQRGVCLRLRQKSSAADLILRVVDGFREHRTGMYAALLSHFGFLSIFPLLTALTSILGFVLEGDKPLRKTIRDSALAHVPIVGGQLKQDAGGLKGSVLLIVFGIATALWAGTKAFVAAQNAMNEIWEVPRSQRPNLVKTRLRAFSGIGIVGVSQIGSGILAGIISVSSTNWISRILLAIAAIAFNTITLFATYRVLTAKKLQRDQLMAGAITSGVGLFVLQIFTTTIVSRALDKATPVYGSFGGVIALLGWLSLTALIALIGVEVNAALDQRRRGEPNVAS